MSAVNNYRSVVERDCCYVCQQYLKDEQNNPLTPQGVVNEKALKILSCKHVLHNECYQQSRRHQTLAGQRCGLCRAPFREPRQCTLPSIDARIAVPFTIALSLGFVLYPILGIGATIAVCFLILITLFLFTQAVIRLIGACLERRYRLEEAAQQV